MVDPIMLSLCVILLTTGVIALAVAISEYCVRERNDWLDQ